jgi:hypothetical protein
MRKEIRDEINRANAERSTGPKTTEGKQRSAMNAFRHGLTGQSLMLQPNEMEAYNRLTAEMLSTLKPKTELERQLAQKIIEGYFRLNRLAAVENNMFNFGLIQHTTTTDHDDRVEVMVAQTRSWFEQANAFDVLGRYETRLSRQLHKYSQDSNASRRNAPPASAPNARPAKAKGDNPIPAANAMKTSEITSIWLRLAGPLLRW